MKRITVRLALLLLTLACAVNGRAQTPCDFQVRKVNFVDTNGLNAEQRTALQQLVEGRCYERDHVDVLTDVVYRQLLIWGFKQAMVEDPDQDYSVRVLDVDAHPAPVWVVMYFRLFPPGVCNANRK